MGKFTKKKPECKLKNSPLGKYEDIYFKKYCTTLKNLRYLGSHSDGALAIKSFSML